MGFLSRILGRRRTILEDIAAASGWIVEAAASAGYRLDYTLDSMKEIDRFFDEQNGPDGILSSNRGGIIFALGAYVGQTAIKLYGGQWLGGDTPGEANAAVQLADGSFIFPVEKCVERCRNGAEDGLFPYMAVLGRKNVADGK